MATKEKDWVPYDQIVSSVERPGEEYVCLDSDETLGLRRDVDGVVWLTVETPKRSAMIRIEVGAAGSIVAGAIEDYLAAKSPAPVAGAVSGQGGET